MRTPNKKISFKRFAQMLKRGKPDVRKDGSMAIKPIVSVDVEATESEVTTECVEWLRSHGCRMKRQNNGAGYLNDSPNYATYGIVGSADFTGMLPSGRRLEVEFKKGKGGVLSKAQADYMDWARAGDGVYVYVHGLAELKEKMKNYLDI